jgi:hypothetical protein
LVDDSGGHSDYEDYFGQETTNKDRFLHKNVIKPQENESINFNLSKETYNHFTARNHPNTEESLIEDEEIKLNPGSYSFVSRS